MDDSSSTVKSSHYLTGHILYASPFIEDIETRHSVVYVCGHDQNGAMGLMINRPLTAIKFDDVIQQLNLGNPSAMHLSIVTGGYNDGGRGFVLHSAEYRHSSTIVINDDFALTATLDILQNMTQGNGPSHAILALGYMAWEAGELEAEITRNSWFTMPATPNRVFHTPTENMWDEGMKQLHISPASLVIDGGRA